MVKEQRKEILKYMWTRPYGEVAGLIAILAGLEPLKTESKNGKDKKDMAKVSG